MTIKRSMPEKPRLYFRLALIVILSIVYANTLAPDITWANRGADGADLIAATITGGVPHPSGYPTYMVLARLFQLIPIGSLAFRTNLMSAVIAILTALLISDLARRSVAVKDGQAWLPDGMGFITGLAFGLSPLFWSQAVITEVYTLHAFFIALILLVTLFLGDNVKEVQNFAKHSESGKIGLLNRPWLDRIGGLLFGLALGNQLTVVFLLPVWLWVGLFQHSIQIAEDMSDGKTSAHGLKIMGLSKESFSLHLSKPDWQVLLRRLFWLLLGLSIYALIPLRARSGSPVNWGNPVDLKGLWWLVSGQLYQDRLFSLDLVYLWPRIRNWAGWLQTQYGLIGLIIGFYGLLYGKPRYKRFYWITAWMFLAYSIFAVGYNSSDSYVLLIPAYMAFALWIGLGVGSLFEFVERLSWRAFFVPVVGVSMVLIVAINAWVNYADVDASQDSRAVDFAAEVLASAPSDAILFVHEDEDIFTLRYYTYVLGLRSDLVVLSEALIMDWYRQTMRETYHGLLIPENNCYDCLKSDIIAANSRQICDIVLNGEEVMDCMP